MFAKVFIGQRLVRWSIVSIGWINLGAVRGCETEASSPKIRTYLEFRREPSKDWPRRRAAEKVGRARHPISSSLFRIAFSVAAFTLLSPLLHRSRSSSIIPRRVFNGARREGFRVPARGPHSTDHPSSRRQAVEYKDAGKRWKKSEKNARVSVLGFTVGARVLITWLITPAKQIATVVNRGYVFSCN